MMSMPSAAIGPVAMPQQPPLLTPADILRVLRRSLIWIVLSVVLAGAIGTTLYYWQLKTNPRYRAEGTLFLNRQFREMPGDKGGMFPMDMDYNLAVEQRTQVSMLMQPKLWDDELANDQSPIRDTDWYHEFERQVASRKEVDTTPGLLARNDLAQNFRVSPVAETKLVRVTMEARVPEDAKTIIESIVGTHIRNQESLTFDRNNQELETAKKWRRGYVTQIGRLQSQIADLNTKLNGGGALQQNRVGIKEMEISSLIGALTKARLDVTEAQGQLDSINAMIEKGTDPPQVEMVVRNDLTVVRLRGMLDDLELQMETALSNGGEKSKYYLDLVARRDSARAKLQRSESEARANARNQIIDQIKSSLQAKKSEEAGLGQRVDTLRDELGEISAKLTEYWSAKDEYDAYKALMREVDQRISGLTDATSVRSAGVAWQAMPVKPDKMSSPQWQVYIPVAMMLGLALSVGLAFLREVMDTSVRSPRDIAKVGPMNLLGMIADESNDPQLAGVPLHVIISQAPHSIMAEQFRQVRTRLQHAASLDTTRTIVVTSPGPQDGKSVVACNLAAGLALNGRRILLVDANFRRPELHKLFNVPNDMGFANVLDSVANLESAVQKTNVPNLELLPTGPRPGNPTELLESQLFSDFIDRALEEYDHVIFDTGPLLVVSEAVALAPRVDGVITVVRAKVNSRGMLSRVRDTLKQIKAEHLGVVLNGVQNWGGGYYGRNIKTYYAYQNVE
jgi:capsular exopolysaccharide synthesis family protein